MNILKPKRKSCTSFWNRLGLPKNSVSLILIVQVKVISLMNLKYSITGYAFVEPGQTGLTSLGWLNRPVQAKWYLKPHCSVYANTNFWKKFGCSYKNTSCSSKNKHSARSCQERLNMSNLPRALLEREKKTTSNFNFK